MAGKAERELHRAARLEALRVRGVRGGVIGPHRAMVGLHWSAWRLVSTLVLAFGGVGLFIAGLPWLSRFWQLVFEWGRRLLGIAEPLGALPLGLPGGLSVAVPIVTTTTPLPDARALGVAGIATAVALGASFLLPARFTPLRYFLRMMVIIQATAILFFALSPEPFPYRLADHVFLLLSAGLVVMGLVPLVLGLTLHVFDLSLGRKVLFTLLLLGHLAVFVPLVALVHVWIVLHASAVVMPLLFLVFGLLLDVLVFVAFYGWALSGRGELDSGDMPAPVHV